MIVSSTTRTHEGMLYRVDLVVQKDITYWKIYENNDLNLHAWIFNLEFHSLEGAFQAIDEDSDYQIYLKEKYDPNNTRDTKPF